MFEFHILKGETADALTTYIMKVLHKYKLSHNIIAFCGENSVPLPRDLGTSYLCGLGLVTGCWATGFSLCRPYCA
jgi:hypothetical protein